MTALLLLIPLAYLLGAANHKPRGGLVYSSRIVRMMKAKR